MDREVYVSEGKYCLIRLTKADKDKYLELLAQVTSEPELFERESYSEFLWNFIVEASDNENYSIYDDNGEYCGNVVLNDVNSDTPEIGIDLLETKRNCGIAARVIKMLARKVYESRKVEYYLLKVSSLNLHSKHMIEKLGTVLIGDEECFVIQAMKQIEEKVKDDKVNEIFTDIKAEVKESQEVVYQYKLMPEVFLN